LFHLFLFLQRTECSRLNNFSIFAFIIPAKITFSRRALMRDEHKKITKLRFFNRININRYHNDTVKIAHSKKKIKPDCVGASSIVAQPLSPTLVKLNHGLIFIRTNYFSNTTFRRKIIMYKNITRVKVFVSS